MTTILVVEDDQELCELFCTVLEENGYIALTASNGEQALTVLENKHVDLIVSDIMMPKMDGYQLTKSLRDANYTLPILMVTARESMADKQQGFLAGTDDYMVKPVDVNELVWRIAALLRRSRIVGAKQLSVGGTALDGDALTVTDGEEEILLPQKEFLILFKLLSSVGRIFTRRQIIDEIWGPDFDGDAHTLEVHISRLRDRFRNNADFEIITVRGLGYKAVKRK